MHKGTWSFDKPSDFIATETLISESEVVLQSYNYNWNQSTKNDFEKGGEEARDNVTITQTSYTEEVWTDDFEDPGPNGWEHGTLSGNNKNEWERGNVLYIPEFIGSHGPDIYAMGTRFNTKYNEDGTPSDYYLQSPIIDLRNSEKTEMIFWHYYIFENDTSTNDGGIIEVSTANGWEQIWPKAGYGSHIQDNNNPLYPTDCFGGNSSSWVQARFDLSKYDGEENFTFRLRFATNGQVSDWGWYIDDFVITSTTYSDGEVELGSNPLVIGNDPDNKLPGPKDMTIIDTNNPTNYTGILTEWEVHILNFTPPATGIMKIFKRQGDDFVLVDETEPEDILTSGKNIFTCSIAVEKDYYIGWYSENAIIYMKNGGTAYNMSGNIIGTNSISNWTPLNNAFSIRAVGISKIPTGSLTSQVFDADSSAIWEEIRWHDDPSNPGYEYVDIVLQVRTGNPSGDTDISWSPWSSHLSNPEGSLIIVPNGQYIQFRAFLTTEQQPYTPTLFDVSISYKKHSTHGEVETNNLFPEFVVQWWDFSVDETKNGQVIEYYYSLDSSENWVSIPSGRNLSSVSVLTGKIRFKAMLSTEDTTMSPSLSEISLTYTSASPDMELTIEKDKGKAEPGEIITYSIFYRNKGIGDARDVSIILFLDDNLTFKDQDDPVSPTIEGNSIIWQFESVVAQTIGSNRIKVDAEANNLRKETTIVVNAVLNYTDIGDNQYSEVISNSLSVKITPHEDLFTYYLTIGAIISAIVIISAVLIVRRNKALQEGEREFQAGDVDKGIGYLIMEENPSKSYGLFSDLIDNGYKGLCITRAFPGRVISNYSFEGVSLLWLSRSKDSNSIIPTNLGGLLRDAKDFMEANKDSVILLDGIEYLIVHNDFQRVLKLVHGINELVAINDSVLIMPLNPLTMEKDKVALLRRDLKILG
jgi:uncharacterized repeat protein (TIGR01451 family)